MKTFMETTIWQTIRRRTAVLILCSATLFSACGDNDPVTPDPGVEDDLIEMFDLQTLGDIPYPADNPPRAERIALGRLLFFDPILGGEKDVACATCHHPDFGFADGRQLPVGTSGVGLGPNRFLTQSAMTGALIDFTPRNAPTIFNTAFNGDINGRPSAKGLQFWDGRAEGLEAQASKPITSRVEMRGDAYPGSDEHAAAAALDSVLARLQAIPDYETLFRAAFPKEAQEIASGNRTTAIDSSTYARSIAAYERELVTRNSAYDRFVGGDGNALTAQQKWGLELFFTKAKCGDCHNGPMFSDYQYVVQAVPQEGPGKDTIPGDDLGREEHTGLSRDRYAFRTPTLRNVELTAPYMHDGVFYTLEEVVDFYNEGASPRHPEVPVNTLHPSLREPLDLSDEEAAAVVAFMRALTDPGTALPAQLVTPPERVPSDLMPVFGVKGPGFGKLKAGE